MADAVHELGRAKGPARALVALEALAFIGLKALGQVFRPVADLPRPQERTVGRKQWVGPREDAAGGAAPAPILGPGHETRPHGVEVDVAGGLAEVGVLHGIRGKAPLPEVAAPAPAEIDAARVVAVGFADGEAQGLLALGHGDEVDVVGHEAPAPDPNAMALAMLGEQLDVGHVVALAEKGLLAAVAALGDVVREAGGDDAGESGHGGSMPPGVGAVKK